MKLLIVGLGSMGKRRIRNLQALQAGELIGCDPREDRRTEVERMYGIQTAAAFEDGLRSRPDAVVISTPPELHLPYARAALQHGKHYFSEVGVGTEGINELQELARARQLVAAPSCTLRFHPLIQQVKQLVETRAIGAIISFSSHSGQYLPDWHPWEDYRSFWASQRQTGACREQFVLEAIWLTWVLGPIRAVACMKGKQTALETDIDDVYQMIMRMGDNILGHMMLDVVSRVPYRSGRLFSESGIIEWSLTEKRVRVFVASNQQWQEHTEPPCGTETGYVHAEHMYVEEMAHFLRAIQGEEPWMFTLDDEREIQEALLAAEHSAEEGMTRIRNEAEQQWNLSATARAA